MDIWDDLRSFEFTDDSYERINEGWKHSEETKRLIGEANLRRPNRGITKAFLEGRKRVGPWNKGIKGQGVGTGTKMVEYKGKVFKSLTAAAKHFQVTVGAVSQNCIRL